MLTFLVFLGIAWDCKRAADVINDMFPNEIIDHESASAHVQGYASIESVGRSTFKSEGKNWYEQQEEIQANIAYNGGVPKW